MNKQSVSIILNNLRTDLWYFLIFTIIVGIVLGLWYAGAKLLELKGMDRWPSVFAVLPIFWIFAAFFDPKPEKARSLTQKFSLIFGTLSIGFIIFIIRLF